MGLDNLSKFTGKNDDSKAKDFSLGAIEGIEEAAIEQKKMIGQIEDFIAKEGIVKRTYVDEAGYEKVGLFRENNSELTLSELWEFTDSDLPSLPPETQRELQEYWDRYHIGFKDYDPEKELEEKFSGFFGRMKGDARG